MLDRLRRLHPRHLREVARAMVRFRRPLRIIAAYLGVRRTPPEVELRNGPRIRLSAWEDLLSVWGVWVRDDYPVQPRDRLILDVGANIGAFALRAATISPDARVVAVEPVSATFRQLEDNVNVNDLAGRIDRLRFGVAGSSGPRTITVTGASAFSTMFGHAGEGAVEEIPTRSLADLLDAVGTSGQVDLLKMDCEGTEMECLLAAPAETLRRCRTIALEFHEVGDFSVADLERHLTGAGFRRRRIERQGDSICGFAWFERQ